jgi:hypothetical protein
MRLLCARRARMSDMRARNRVATLLLALSLLAHAGGDA